ncbi:RING finger protein 148-like [Engraulis encrasicolus]|uniref:RING finger protein 148-like n=1 Tax=Engraulis encrasicolus TaxID=184585 RepID=UPI002FCED18B
MTWNGRRFFAWICLLTWVAECSSYSLLYWTAYVSVTSDNSTYGPCECGLYGQHSPLLAESGLLVLPNEDPLACNHTTFNATQTPWIALIKRGNCTYTEKVNAAKRYNASAVVIYNIDGRGNDTSVMSHQDAEGIVTIMIGNELGKDIVSQIRTGADVYMTIDLGNVHGSLANPIWIWIMSFTFFAITAITLVYFTIVTIKKIHQYIILRREERHLKSVAEKAIKSLQVRTLKKGDEEVGTDSHTCAVCIDGYKRGEVVMILSCGHFFHKACIEPWLLEHRTCPMCKCNILGVKTVDEEVNVGSSTSPLDVRFYPPSHTAPLDVRFQPAMRQDLYENSDPFYETFDEVSLTDPEESDPAAPQQRQAPSESEPKQEPQQAKEAKEIHDNAAFEGDSNSLDLK